MQVFILFDIANKSLRDIKENKLRTMLSSFSLGVSVFVLVTIFSVIDTMQENVNLSVSRLGENAIYISRYPWGALGTDRRSSQFDKREPIIGKHFEKFKTIIGSQFLVSSQSSIIINDISYNKKRVPDLPVTLVDDGYDNIIDIEMSKGRFFNPAEYEKGFPSIVVGFDLANELHIISDNSNEVLRIEGIKFKIIGIIKKQGDIMSKSHLDNSLFITRRSCAKIVKTDLINMDIIVKSRNSDISQHSSYIETVMKAIRNQRPSDAPNFSINTMDFLRKDVESIASKIKIGGGLISSFGLLIGMINITNIMVFIVRQRFTEIGLLRAVGAKRSHIFLQFIVESMLIGFVGSIIGLAFAFCTTLILSLLTPLTIQISLLTITKAVLIGLGFSGLGGISPALYAAHLNPASLTNQGQM